MYIKYEILDWHVQTLIHINAYVTYQRYSHDLKLLCYINLLDQIFILEEEAYLIQRVNLWVCHLPPLITLETQILFLSCHLRVNPYLPVTYPIVWPPWTLLVADSRYSHSN